MAVVIVIVGWQEYQHYKDRDPPWVKLHRSMLTSGSWMYGTNLSRNVQIASILLAPRYGNKIPCDPDLLRKAGHVDGSDVEIRAALAYLVEHNFLDIQEVADVDRKAAINLLARCSSEERREETEKNCSAAAPPAPVAIKSLAVPRGTSRRREEPEWLAPFKAVYPQRSGDPNWRGAIRAGCARLQEGHTVEQFMAGAKRYAEFCRVTGKLGQETVQQASRFLGPGKGFMLPWDLPKGTAKPAHDPWPDLHHRKAKSGYREPREGESPQAYHTALARHEDDLRRGRSSSGPARAVPELRQ